MAVNPPAHMSQPQSQVPQSFADPVNQIRALVQQLKESLSNVMRMSAASISHNAQSVETPSKSGDGKFNIDKGLEDFFAVLNQIERHLRTISECVVQQRESNKYLPFPVSSKLDTSGPVEMSVPNEVPTISYNQYMHIVRAQTNFIKSIQELLVEGAHKVGRNESGPAPASSVAPTSTA